MKADRGDLRPRPAWPPLAWTAVAAGLGILLVDRWEKLTAAVTALAVAVACGWFWRCRRRLALLMAVAAAFGLLHRMEKQRQDRFPWAKQLAEGQALPASAEGVVIDLPVITARGCRFPLRLDRLSAGGYRAETPDTVIVQAPLQVPPPHYGDRLKLRGVLKSPRAARNPGEFDYAHWLRRNGIASELEIANAGGFATVASGGGSRLMAFALACRVALAERLVEGIADRPREAAAIRAMVLGMREDMPEDVDADFLNSGTLHVFSVSGLHVALVAALIWFALGIFGLGQRSAAVVSLPLIFFYALMTGWQPPAVRSAVMLGIVLLGQTLDRPTSMMNSLAAAAIVLLAWRTDHLFLPGCQLSFVVLASLALFSGPLAHWARPTYTADPFFPKVLLTRWQERRLTVARHFVKGVCASLAAGIGSTLLTVPHFQLVTPVSLVANLALVPLTSAIVSTACLSLLGGLASQWLAVVLNHANLGLTWLCLVLAHGFASVPYAWTRCNPANFFRENATRITVFDVGAGAAIEIQTHSGNDWLIDSGGGYDGRSVVVPGLGYLGVRTLDGIFLTHGDQRHVGGLPVVIPFVEPRALYHPGGDFRSAAYDQALAAVPATLHRELTAGVSVPLDSGVTATVLFPPAGWKSGLADDASMVLRVDAGKIRVLFLPDAGFVTQQWLRQNRAADLQADIVIGGHHVRDGPPSVDFLSAVKARCIIVSHADFPRIERVDPNWRTAAEAAGITVVSQEETGAVEVGIGSGPVRLRPFLGGREITLDPP